MVGLDCGGLTCNFKLASCSAYVGVLKDLTSALELSEIKFLNEIDFIMKFNKLDPA